MSGSTFESTQRIAEEARQSAQKHKRGESVKCPNCGYYTRVYGVCYVCLHISGKRSKKS